MIAMSTFIQRVYGFVEQFSTHHLPPEPRRAGPKPALDRTTVLVLAMLAQWSRFRSERDFYRFMSTWVAEHPYQARVITSRIGRLPGSLPGSLPERSQYNRQLRRYSAELAALSIWIAEQINARAAAVQAIDTTAISVRNSRRRGNGWLFMDADIGRSGRLGWFHGVRLLVSVSASGPARGAITGFCLAPASTGERAMAEALFALRQRPSPMAPSVGLPALGAYLADTGFAGSNWVPRWRSQYGASVICRGQCERWPKALRRWLAHYRQLVETVFAKLHGSFGLDRERPHRLEGLMARVAARIALHNTVIWCNLQDGRPALHTEGLLGWM